MRKTRSDCTVGSFEKNMDYKESRGFIAAAYGNIVKKVWYIKLCRGIFL